jgi:hypothetical protein
MYLYYEDMSYSGSHYDVSSYSETCYESGCASRFSRRPNCDADPSQSPTQSPTPSATDVPVYTEGDGGSSTTIIIIVVVVVVVIIIIIIVIIVVVRRKKKDSESGKDRKKKKVDDGAEPENAKKREAEAIPAREAVPDEKAPATEPHLNSQNSLGGDDPGGVYEGADQGPSSTYGYGRPCEAPLESGRDDFHAYGDTAAYSQAYPMSTSQVPMGTSITRGPPPPPAPQGPPSGYGASGGPSSQWGGYSQEYGNYGY